MSSIYLGATSPDTDISLQQELIIEVVLTFLLVFTIFGVAVDSRSSPDLAGFAISGFVLFLGYHTQKGLHWGQLLLFPQI